LVGWCCLRGRLLHPAFALGQRPADDLDAGAVRDRAQGRSID
jgi:hypothetical protein